MIWLLDYFWCLLTLSKAQISIPPQRGMCLECKQYTSSFSNLFWANALFAVKAAGRIGGTTNVKISNELSNISCKVPWKNQNIGIDDSFLIFYFKNVQYPLIFKSFRNLLTPFLCHMYKEYDIPTRPIERKTPIDLMKSRWNLKSNGGGNSIDRTSSPFVVMNPKCRTYYEAYTFYYCAFLYFAFEVHELIHERGLGT